MPTLLCTATATHTTPVHLNFWHTAIYKINFLTVTVHTQFPNSNGFLRTNLYILTYFSEYPLCASIIVPKHFYIYYNILYSLSSTYVTFTFTVFFKMSQILLENVHLGQVWPN
jgi:hypothetical protein